jgi:hypothetical protein
VCWHRTPRLCNSKYCKWISVNAGDQGKPGEAGPRNIGRGSCRSALADGVERRSTAVVLG